MNNGNFNAQNEQAMAKESIKLMAKAEFFTKVLCQLASEHSNGIEGFLRAAKNPGGEQEKYLIEVAEGLESLFVRFIAPIYADKAGV